MLDTPCSDVECKTTGYPLHSHVSPSLPLTCVAVCHQVSTGLRVQTHVALYVVPEVMARVCAQDKAEGNGSMAAEVTSSEKEVLIVILKLQYYSYKTGFYAHSQAAK